jgi:hypothetical protein
MKLSLEIVAAHGGITLPEHYTIEQGDLSAAEALVAEAEAALVRAKLLLVRAQWRWDNDLCNDEGHWTDAQREALATAKTAVAAVAPG